MRFAQLAIKTCLIDPIQIPYFTADTIKRCEEKGIETVFDVLEASDEDREAALQMDDRRVQDVALYCNRYPAVDVQYKVVCCANIACADGQAMATCPPH